MRELDVVLWVPLHVVVSRLPCWETTLLRYRAGKKLRHPILLFTWLAHGYVEDISGANSCLSSSRTVLACGSDGDSPTATTRHGSWYFLVLREVTLRTLARPDQCAA